MESPSPYKKPFPTSDEAAQAAGSHLTHLFANAHRAGKPVLFLSSGGSALNLLTYTSLPADIRLTITMLDDRYSTDPQINNFIKFENTDFYNNAVRGGASVIETKPEREETLAHLADRYDSALRTWREQHPDGVIIATMGIGPDGHTTGMFPYPENPDEFDRLFVHTTRWVVGYDAAGKHQYTTRVTTTLPFLKTIDHTIMYASGVEKQRALDMVITEGEKLSATPAAVIHHMKDVRIYTDINAD